MIRKEKKNKIGTLYTIINEFRSIITIVQRLCLVTKFSATLHATMSMSTQAELTVAQALLATL